MEITYTLLGDENLGYARPFPSLPRNNLHPVRGRKPVDQIPYRHDRRNNLHPVRGRKPRCMRSPSCIPGNNLHPARGRKKLLTHVDKEQKEIDTYETYFILSWATLLITLNPSCRFSKKALLYGYLFFKLAKTTFTISNEFKKSRRYFVV